MKKKRGPLILILVLLFCLAGAYIVTGLHYHTHFFKNTSINGVDVSGCTAKEAEERIKADEDSYQLVLTARNPSGSEPEQETIPGSAFDYHYVSDGEIENLLAEQPSFLWFPVSLSGRRDLSLETPAAYDEEKLKQAVSSLKCMQADQMIAPENAYVFLQADGTYGIIPETQGTTLDPEKTEEAVRTAIRSAARDLDLEEAGCYTSAEVTSKDPALLKEQDMKNQYRSVVITYSMGGGETVTLDASTFMDWICLDDKGLPDFDREAIASWVDELADAYDTIGTLEPFETSHALTVYVEAITYGWEMDRYAEAEDLHSLLLEGKSQKHSPVWIYSADTRGENDIGKTYVEIDYTNQQMWYYRDGNLIVETPVVSGNVSSGDASPEGMYYIFMKERDATLEGEGYSTPVSYWMPFYGNVGIHDADTWRSSYGGSIYLNNGSHGCINTPRVQAAAIYQDIEVGTPVICYASGIQYESSGENTDAQADEETEDHGLSLREEGTDTSTIAGVG